MIFKFITNQFSRDGQTDKAKILWIDLQAAGVAETPQASTGNPVQQVVSEVGDVSRPIKNMILWITTKKLLTKGCEQLCW